MTELRDAPGLIVPPPLVYLPAVAVGFLLHRYWPIAVLPTSAQYTVGPVLLAVSAAIMPLVLREFRKAHTNFAPRKPTTSIITGGPFRFSRNPSYLSLTVVCLGIAVVADKVWIIVALVPVLVFMNYVVIPREEQYLEGKFGEEYLRYKRSVRRWL